VRARAVGHVERAAVGVAIERTRPHLLFEKLTLLPKLIKRPAKSPLRARLAMARPREKTVLKQPRPTGESERHASISRIHDGVRAIQTHRGAAVLVED
jgi:hypothetical protein